MQPKRLPDPSPFKELEEKKALEQEDRLGGPPNVLKIREIDLEPPEVHGRNVVGMKRILTEKVITDSTHHKNGEIKK